MTHRLEDDWSTYQNAKILARRIEYYWHRRGKLGVRTRLVKGIVIMDHTMWYVRSNIAQVLGW